MNTIARCRFATSNTGRMFSASFFVRKPLPGTCAPTTPGSASARSNSAAVAQFAYLLAAGNRVFIASSSATACSTTVPLKKSGLLRVCSVAALVKVNS